MKTTAGPVTLARPKVRGTTERFASQLFGKGVTKTNALESLVIAGFVRALSVRDVEATLVEALGAGANADLDIMLCVLAQALIAALRARLPGYASVTPDVLQRRFLETPGQITTSRDTITVRLDRRAYSPVLRQADLPHNTRVPWWDNRTLRFEFS